MKIIGNQSVIVQLEIAAKACRKERRPLPHTLFTGAAGCGKTTTAKFIAELMETELLHMSPVGVGDTTAFAKALIGSAKRNKRFPIIFIDEVHRVSPKDQELLGVLMEELMAPVRLGMSDQEVKIKIPPFTMIGATTDLGKLLKPFRDRFKLIFTFKSYTNEEAKEIAKTHANRLGVAPTDKQLSVIGEAGRFTPRNIVSILERYRDFVLAVNQGNPTLKDDLFYNMIAIMGIKEEGLTQQDIDYLLVLEEQDAPVGLEVIAMLLNEGPNTIRTVIEPYLLQKGFISRTSRGRLITPKGLEYLYRNGYAKEKDLAVQEFDFLE